MIDTRHETFLALCSIGNYTKTAQALHITQPAVSQHIKYLEEAYAGKLFIRKGKTLKLTAKGSLLYRSVMTVHADSVRLQAMLEKCEKEPDTVQFGATLSIGSYMMPPILSNLMKNQNTATFSMLVENTQTLLAKLETGEIGFACIEGFFDKTKYEWRLFSEEQFIAVCQADSALSKTSCTIEALMKERLIVRESGSGTREILEQFLWQKNLRLDSFSKKCEISDMQAIKELVKRGSGITFLYKATVERELRDGSLCMIDIKNFSIIRAFYFVCLKNSLHKSDYLSWFDRFLVARKQSIPN